MTSGKQESENFSVLTLTEEDEFECKEIIDVYDNNTSIECIIDKIPNQGFANLENAFFKVSYKMIDKNFRLYIYPKHTQKLFGIPKDPREEGFAIDKEQPKKAKIWQIIGYKNKIPFLSQAPKKRGLNFSVKILSQELPFIPELNIDNIPLNTTKNQDFNIYTEVEKLIKDQDYITALSEINEAIKVNPDSVFRRDLTYNRILAMSKLNLEDKDPLINAGLDWVKNFPSDPDIPEVFYILADAYGQEFMQTESEYYYHRIMDEFPHSRFAPLSQMQIAKNYNKADNKVYARMFFQKAYTEAKDMPSASEIAIEWALFEIQSSNIESAKDIVSKVISAYPKYFVEMESKTQEVLEIFTDLELYDLSTKIIDYMAKNIEDDKKEQYAFMLGEYYARMKDFDLAHKANMDYLQTYDPKSSRYQIVAERDDTILFNIKGDEKQKLAHYEHIISKYPNTPQAQKANELIAEILLKKEDYKQILERMSEGAYRQKALIELTKQALAKNDCKQANIYLLEVKEHNFSTQEKHQAFDCLSEAGLHKIAATLSQGMAQQSKSEKEKLEWLYKDAHNLYALGEYKSAILAARDGFNLAINQKSHYDIAFVLFEILDILQSTNEAKKLLPFFEKHFRDDPRILNVYAKLLEYANADQDLMSTQIYAQNIIDLQKKLQIDDFTPYAEFALAKALDQSQKPILALKVLENLEFSKLNPQETQQLFYQIASLYNAQNDTKQALAYFDKCFKMPQTSDWQTLCKQAYDMIMTQDLESSANEQDPESSQDSSTEESIKE